MRMSLQRKLALRGQAAADRAVAREIESLARTSQVARSTVAVGDSDVPVVETVEVVQGTASDVAVMRPETSEAGESAYDAYMKADDAEALATTAMASADGKAMIYRSIDEPDDGLGTVGDRWEQYDKAVTPWKLLGSWSRESGGWVAVELASTYLPLVDIGNGTFGQLGGDRLTADAIDGKLITGVTVRGSTIELTNRLSPIRTFDIYAAGPNSTPDTRQFSGHGVTDAESNGTAPNWIYNCAFKAGTNLTSDLYIDWPDRFGKIDVTITAEVRYNAGLTAYLWYGEDDQKTQAVLANTWTTITMSLTNVETSACGIGFIGTRAAGTSMEVRNFRVQAASTDVGKITISRDEDENARILVTGQDDTDAVLIDQRGVFIDGLMVAGRDMRGTKWMMHHLTDLGLAYKGMRFFCIDDEREYISDGEGEWLTQVTVKGTRVFTSVAAGAAVNATVDFGVTFASLPDLHGFRFANVLNNLVGYYGGLTVTGVDLYARNNHGGAQTLNVGWGATGWVAA